MAVISKQISITAGEAAAAAAPIPGAEVAAAASQVFQRRGKLKPQPNLSVARNQASTKSQRTNKKQKNIRYDVVREQTEYELSDDVTDAQPRQTKQSSGN